MPNKNNPKIQLQTSQFGDLQLPLPETDQIKTLDYVLVTITPQKSLIITKYEHAEKYKPNTFLDKNHYVSFVNYQPQYLKQQSRRKEILSHHQK